MNETQAKQQLEAEAQTEIVMQSATKHRLPSVELALNQAFLDGVSFGLKLAAEQNRRKRVSVS